MSSVDRVVRVARRRLFAQALVNRLVAAWAIALALALAWFLAEPLLLEARTRWVVLVSLVGVATVAAVVLTIRRAPSRLDAALEVDRRFALCERVTSLLSLPESLRDSSAGRALSANAEQYAGPLRARDKFAVRLPRSAVRVPMLAALLAVVAFVYHPVTDSSAWADGKKNKQELATASTGDTKRPAAKAADRPKIDADRANKSAQVKELEAELDRLDRAARESNPTPEQAREKVTEITAAEEKARAAEREAFDKLARMENKLQQLEKLNGADDFKGGPAQELNNALAKGDLAQAEEAVEELRKKLKNQSLTPQESAQLEKQLDQMKSALERLARNADDAQKIKDLIEQAKREGRDTESLDRELERIKIDADQLKGLEDIAKKLDGAKRAMRDGDTVEAAKQLENLAAQLRDLQGEVGDLKDLQEQLQRAEELKAEAVGGQTAGDKKGGGKDGEGPQGAKRGGAKAVAGAGGQGGDKGAPQAGVASGGGVGAGARPENPNAATAKGTDERQRTPFDPKGRKSYGGAVPGPAFTKRSPAEVSGAITVAAQEAADAIANQPLSRDDKEAVKEFIQGLGNQKKP